MKVVVVFLLGALGVMPGLRAQSAPAAGAIALTVDGKTTTLSRVDLQRLPRVSVRIADAGDSATMSGITLWSVLEKVGFPSPQASGRQRGAAVLRLTGADGVSAAVALVEVDPSFSRRTVLLADQRNGKPLDAVEGPWRSILPDDVRHARWIRNLVSISVESVQR